VQACIGSKINKSHIGWARATLGCNRDSKNGSELGFAHHTILFKLQIFETGKIALITTRTGITTAAAIAGAGIAGLRLRAWFIVIFAWAGVCLGCHDGKSL